MTTHIRNEWFQTPEKITFTFYVKNKTADDVTVEATEKTFRVLIRLPDNAEDGTPQQPFEYALTSLFAPIKPDADDIAVNVRSMKVEITVSKQTPLQWAKLEFDASAVAAAASGGGNTTAATANIAAAAPATQKELTYPNSKGRDWNSFKVEEDDDEKNLVGDAALNKLFKDIYAKSDDEKKRAMMKSFQESGGTCLSTNWEDVGARKVECEPPKGMEAKKWEQ